MPKSFKKPDTKILKHKTLSFSFQENISECLVQDKKTFDPKITPKLNHQLFALNHIYKYAIFSNIHFPISDPSALDRVLIDIFVI